MRIWNRLFRKKETTKQPKGEVTKGLSIPGALGPEASLAGCSIGTEQDVKRIVGNDADVNAAKRLLYIDLSNSTNGYRNADTFRKYSEFFTKHYTTEACQHGPREDAFELVCAAKAAGRMFDIIVTNVPESLRRVPENIRRTAILDGIDHRAHHDYIESMSYIAGIKQQLDVPILAFTGAGGTDVRRFIETGFVDEVVKDGEFEAFRAQIDTLLARYEKLPPPSPPAQISETKDGFSARVCVRLNNPLPRSVCNHLNIQCTNGALSLLIAAEDDLSPACNIHDVRQPGFQLSEKCIVGRMACVYVNGKSEESRTFIADVCTALTSRYVFDIPWIMEVQDQSRENPNDIS